jgi:hypothetical protein
VKDSKEQLKRRTRARGTSNATIDTTTSNSTSAGRSYTVANVHNGVIYLRYAHFGLESLVVLVHVAVGRGCLAANMMST